jgi:hypothetical protein
MTIEQFNINLNNTVKELQSELYSNVMPRLGSEAFTMIRKRVQESGTNAEGSKFPGYSTRPMLTNCSTMILSACSKVAGSKEKRKELKWVTLKGNKLFELPGGYKQFRELHGRQTSHVDFSFTNKMWNDINVISSASDHAQGMAIIGAKEVQEKKKLEGNTARKGEILDLSQKEIDYLLGQYNLQVLKVFKDNGL